MTTAVEFCEFLKSLTSVEGASLINFLEDDNTISKFVEKLSVYRYKFRKPGGYENLDKELSASSINIKYVIEFLKDQSRIKNKELISNIIYELQYILNESIDSTVKHN